MATTSGQVVVSADDIPTLVFYGSLWQDQAHAPGNWFVDFGHGSSNFGWDAIANHVSNFGWEIRQMVPQLWLPANKFGGSRVVSYLVMCIQPD